jgi:excisionase family DNA binding protein
VPDETRFTIAEIAARIEKAAFVDDRLAEIAGRIERVSDLDDRLAAIENELRLRRKTNVMQPRTPIPAKAEGAKILFTTDDAAQALSCCRQTVLRLINKGYIKALRTGRTIRIHRKEMEAFSRYVEKFGLPSVWDAKSWPGERKVRSGEKS